MHEIFHVFKNVCLLWHEILLTDAIPLLHAVVRVVISSYSWNKGVCGRRVG